MLSGLKEKMPAVGFDLYKKALVNIVEDARFENLILSGAEVTTFDELDKYVQLAASMKWFKKIQIQTNGRRLKDREYLRYLIDCGVNEFFVSIQGLEEAHDAITGRPGSFKETMEGIHNLAAFPVNVITNTVLTRKNYHDVAPLVMRLCKMEISEIHLWNFFPMEKTDTGNLLVSMNDFMALLADILPIVRPTGKPLVLKSFPECLPIEEPGFIDSGFPVTVLPDLFWREFGKNRFGICVYRNECAAHRCWGLCSAYIEKYGDERDRLRPMR